MTNNMRIFYLYLTTDDDVLILKDERDDSKDNEDFIVELAVDDRNNGDKLVGLIQKVLDFSFAKKAMAQILQERGAPKDISKLN